MHTTRQTWIRFAKLTIASILIAAVSLSVATVSGQSFQPPTDGNFYYNGYGYADSQFSWQTSPSWTVSNPGYEHDITLSPNFYDLCTTTTTLPDGYDDCPTAGVLDGGRWAFGAGSFAANQIRQWNGIEDTYYVTWNFHLTVVPIGHHPGDFVLSSQEVERSLCSFKNIWCMAGTGGYSSLLSGTLVKGQYFFANFSN